MADMTLVDSQPMYVSSDLLSNEILQKNSEDLSQIPLPRFARGSKDLPERQLQSSQHHHYPVLQQELLKLEQQQILRMKLQQRQMLFQQVQELQGQMLSQPYQTQGVGCDNGGYPMASSPYLESPEASMGSWYESQIQETWIKPKVKAAKGVSTKTRASNHVPNKYVPGVGVDGEKDTQQKILKLPKANLNKTDDKNKGVSTAGMIWIGFDRIWRPSLQGPKILSRTTNDKQVICHSSFRKAVTRKSKRPPIKKS